MLEVQEGDDYVALIPGWVSPLSCSRKEGDPDRYQVHLSEGCPEALEGPGHRGAPPAGAFHGVQQPIPALAE